MTHGNQMFKTATDIAIVEICEYPSSKYALPYWKCFMRCCEQFTCIDLPSTESDHQNYNASTTISFQVYNLIIYCTLTYTRPFNEKKQR